MPEAVNRSARCLVSMHPEVPRADVHGLTSLLAILTFCAEKPTHEGGAYRL